METNKISIMVNGLPGKMASLIASQLISLGHLMEIEFELLKASLTGDGMPDEVEIDGMTFKLIPPSEHRQYLQELWAENIWLIVIDFTQPSAANNNVNLYCELSFPFIMGTTGGDREKLEESVQKSDICAVIAPNMAAPVVAFQAMMEYAAENFPGVFKNYFLTVRESHQQGKADTSGTAKAMVGYFNRMGVEFSINDIVMERDPKEQEIIWGIPVEHLAGHGWHTYTLKSPDGSTELKFIHNINGRDIYAQGTFMAIKYLAKKIAENKSRGQVFSMGDVLKGK